MSTKNSLGNSNLSVKKLKKKNRKLLKWKRACYLSMVVVIGLIMYMYLGSCKWVEKSVQRVAWIAELEVFNFSPSKGLFVLHPLWTTVSCSLYCLSWINKMKWIHSYQFVFNLCHEWNFCLFFIEIVKL